jgi:hypothetical protein
VTRLSVTSEEWSAREAEDLGGNGDKRLLVAVNDRRVMSRFKAVSESRIRDSQSPVKSLSACKPSAGEGQIPL